MGECDPEDECSWFHLYLHSCKFVSFCFLTHSLIMAYWKPKCVHGAGFYTTNMQVVFNRHSS